MSIKVLSSECIVFILIHSRGSFHFIKTNVDFVNLISRVVYILHLLRIENNYKAVTNSRLAGQP